MQKHAGAGRVDIAVHCDAETLSVSVSDDGVGFTPVQVPRDHFSRAGGFGLASTLVPMQAIGGQLDIRSVPGAGTHARILLPLVDPQAGAAPW